MILMEPRDRSGVNVWLCCNIYLVNLDFYTLWNLKCFGKVNVAVKLSFVTCTVVYRYVAFYVSG